MKYININQITYIESYLNKIETKYGYKSEISIFGYILRKGGFYDDFGNYISMNSIDLDLYYIIDGLNILMRNPYLKIYLSDGDIIKKSFKNKFELETYLLNDLSGIKLIEI